MVLLTALVAAATGVSAEQVARHVLMGGTPYETSCHVKYGDDPWGPKICVIGGLHGNETAGWVAAERLLNWRITRGVLIVLPRAHQEAIRRNARGYPGNMNAMFPGDSQGDAMHRLAAEIWRIVDYYRPSLLLTLHESRGYHKRDPTSYGYTLCHDFSLLDPLMQRCIDRANPDLPDALHRFEIFVEAHPTCPTYCAWRKLRIPATSIETCLEDRLDLRVRHQLMMCMGFFDEARLGYAQADVPSLSTAGQPSHTALEVWGPHFAALEAGRTPAARYGLLQVGAPAPLAKVFVDGEYRGCTPATVAIPTGPGGHTVQVTVQRDGLQAWSTAATVLPEQYTRVMAEPPGS
jgi:hypothetical protein